MAVTVFSLISDVEVESSRRTSTGTTPCATAINTCLSSSCNKPNNESSAEFLDSVEPICNRVIKFLDSTRIGSLLETETEQLTETTSSCTGTRRPLFNKTSKSLI
ncbi:hypothetical protein HanRHA438_Chr09g0424961 [Helianthus annuus]|nr:hypothetical protein HanRHA438_Chr09g0424961 [Helianthus annuus]